MPTAPPAIATADGAVPTLPTASVRGLELLLPGTYTGIAGGANVYSPARLAGIAQAHEELRGYLTPTVKIGHGQQGLLASAELPNAGIIENVYTRGTGPDARLFVDLAAVPAKVAALIKAGNLRARSAELLFDTTHNGKRYDAVLTGMALLGTSQPAVKGLNDVLALYSAPDESALVALTAEAREAVTVELADAPSDPSDYAYVPDPDKPSTWKLRIDDAAHISAAAAALGPGYRGQKVDIPDADRAAVVAKVRAAWKKAYPDKEADDMPEGIKLAAKSSGTKDDSAEPVLSPSQQAADAAAACKDPDHEGVPAGIHKKMHMPAKAVKNSARGSARVLLSGPAFDEIQAAVQDALEEAYPYVVDNYGMAPSGNSADGPSPWIAYLFDDSVVTWDQDHDALWQVDYTFDADTGEATLGDASRCRLIPQTIAGAAAMAAPSTETHLADEPADYAQHFAGLESAMAQVGAHLNGLKSQKGVGPARMMHKELASKVAAMKGRLVADSAPEGSGGITTAGNTSAETPLDADKKPGGGARLQQEESMQDTEIRALLSLGPDDDIKQTLIGLKARTVELSDHQAVVQERDALLAEKRQTEATTLVDDAINAGKLVPKMRDWAISLAQQDKSSLEVYLSSAAGFTMWSGAGEVGVSGEVAAKHAPSPTALRLAQEMGVDPAAFADTRSTREKYEAALRAKGVDIQPAAGKVA